MPNLTDARIEASPAGRALVTSNGAAARSVNDVAVSRPLAGFVTQLIASNGRVPAYRRAVRAEPGQAADAYGEAPALVRSRLDRVV